MPAGEAEDPRRAVPFALIMTIVIVTVRDDAGADRRARHAAGPGRVEDAAGRRGGALPGRRRAPRCITLGAVFSTTGNNMGRRSPGSRNLFALAEQGDLPPVFGRVHPRFRTPVNAILVTSGVSLVLARHRAHFNRWRRPARSAGCSCIVATCASTLRLRSRRFDGVVNPPVFVAPLGPVIPIAAIVIAVAVLGGASAIQLRNGMLALLVGAVLYVVAARGSRFAKRFIPDQSPAR